ncbi:biotin transporter BioY, partial [Escherichia coli]
LLAFPVAAFGVGYVVERVRRSGWALRAGVIAAACLAASVVIYAIGVPVVAAKLDIPLTTALTGNLPYLPGDVVKLVLAALVAASVHR